VRPLSPRDHAATASISLTAMSFYLTTPIYYINSTPHIGHAYTTIAADIFVRHQRQRGQETFFLTGTDEHASKVARAAQEQGLDPKEFADRIVRQWQELPRRLNASNDFFIRTTDEAHKTFVQGFIQRIYDNGDIYQDVYEGLYCVGCEAFKTEAEIVDGLCPEHGVPPEEIEETNYFFRLTAYRDRLLALYDSRPDFVLPDFRYNEARSFIAGGLQDFSISRAGQPWGVPIPWDPGQVVYVWVDALINYLSALTYAREGEDLRETFWPGVRHLLGKDILRFHCVYWPALLLAAGYDVPRQLFVHGYLLLDDRKISKSFGNVIDPLDLIDVYGVDAVRYWAARSVSFGQDGTASIDGLAERYERELGNDLGNLLSRTTAMIARYRDGRLEPASGSSADLADRAVALRTAVADALDAFDLTGALDRVWEFVRALNKHVTETKPWELAKDPSRSRELDGVLWDLAEGLRVAAVALAAYLPETSGRILAALGQPADLSWTNVELGRGVAADGIEAAAPLFPRVDAPAPAA
jgi:methionyl-tRNA synthetase